MDWEAKRAWAAAEHAERSLRSSAAGERDDLRLAGIAGASWCEGLSASMLGRSAEAARLLGRAAEEYRASWAAAPAGSWGRPIAAMRCGLMAGATDPLERDAVETLAAGSGTSSGSIAAYATALALLVLRRDAAALPVARALQAADDFVAPVADALVALSSGDGREYALASAAVLQSFEQRDAFLEDTPVADTVLVLDALAVARSMPVSRSASDLLPPPA